MRFVVKVLTLIFFAVFIGCSSTENRPAPQPSKGACTSNGVQGNTKLQIDSDSTDSGVNTDAGPDDSLLGTSLEGIEIEWSHPLELCSQWRESISLDDELAAKVHITLHPEQRESLGRNHLSAATLSQGTIRRSPLSDDHQALPSDSLRLDEYKLGDPKGDTSLSATLVHDFGSAGIITEHLSVTRTPGDKKPLIMGKDFESTFTYQAPGNCESIALELCGGSKDLQSAAQVLVAKNGNNTMTVTRFINTIETLAGSYPVHPTSAVVRLSSEPREAYSVHGFWSQTYSAEHHNWFEDSVIDFTKDLSWYQTAYRPYLDGNPNRDSMMTQLKLLGMDGWDNTPKIVLTQLDMNSGQESQSDWLVDGGWRRVDRKNMEQILQKKCQDGQVVTLSNTSFTEILHLLSCPRNAVQQLKMLVPIAFTADPSQIGKVFEGDAIEPIQIMGRTGHRIKVGDTLVDVTKNANEAHYFVTVTKDGQTVTDRIMHPRPMQKNDPWDETISLKGKDSAPTATLIRRHVGWGIGESLIYAPVSFELTIDKTYRVEAWDLMRYRNSHHNWRDNLEAESEGLLLRWRVEFLTGQNARERHFVSAVRKSDGSEVLAETEVTTQTE